MRDESSEGKRRHLSDDLNTEITAGEREKIGIKAQVQTINTRFKLSVYKWIIRTYVTPPLLHRFNPNVPDNCVKCSVEKGPLFRSLLERLRNTSFWKDVLDILSQISSEKLPMCPQMCILEGFKMNKTKKETE